MSRLVDYSSHLVEARAHLQELQDSIRAVPESHFDFIAPVIDRQHARKWRSDPVRGLKKFLDSVESHAALLDHMIETGATPREDPVPNVLAYVTVWKQCLAARGPIAGVRLNLNGKNKAEGFVDVVARGGREWIKLYSKKQSQLLAEFREQDSYINSDYDSDSDSDEAGPSTRPQPLRNSLLTTVDSLLGLIPDVERIPGAQDPRLTVRVTRIPPTGHADSRIEATFDEVRRKGVKLIFGDFSDTPLSALPVPQPEWTLRPSLRINLDPTALMALCSDLLHHPLPTSEHDAMKRFFRPKGSLQAAPVGRHTAKEHGQPVVGSEDDLGWQGQSQNSRELVKNVLEEMALPLIEEIRDTLGALIESQGQGSVEFWTTKAAVQYLKETLGSDEVVGDGMEQRRMRRLVGLETGDFFEGSRYEGREGVLKDLRVRLFDDDDTHDIPNSLPTSFHGSLSAICRSCLADYNRWTADPSPKNEKQLANFLKPQRMPVPKVATLSLPFPIVSLMTLERGAREGMTTMIMGNIILRDLWSQMRWKAKGWTQGDYEVEDAKQESEVEAVVWMLPYRSLGEGKRVKFERGDYSYPVK